MSQRLAILIAIGFCAAGATQAAGRGDQVFSMNGACSTLRVGARDLTRLCKGKLASFTLANGRVGFTFLIGDEGLLQFSGDGSKQVSLPGQRAIQPIDRVRLTIAKTGPEAVSTTTGSGRCTYGNPFAGTAKLSCRVAAGKGLFVAEFVTDGSPSDEGAL